MLQTKVLQKLHLHTFRMQPHATTLGVIQNIIQRYIHVVHTVTMQSTYLQITKASHSTAKDVKVSIKSLHSITNDVLCDSNGQAIHILLQS